VDGFDPIDKRHSQFKRLLPFFIPFTLVLTVGLTLALRAKYGDPTRHYGPYEEVEYEDISISTPDIRVKAMAHYPIVINQRVPGNLFFEEKNYFLYALFAPYDTKERAIRVIVRTERPPPSLVSYEYMTIEGHLSFPTQEQVPFETEIELGKKTDYFFVDEMLLLEPTSIEVDGEVWTP
jgi:hypothetical protein